MKDDDNNIPDDREVRQPKTNSKLESAIQLAALENLNEDMFEIAEKLQNMTEGIPKLCKIIKEGLKSDVSTLEKALETVPEKFDLLFKEKMNQIIALLSEVDTHSDDLKKALNEDVSNIALKQSQIMVEEFNEKTGGLEGISMATLIFYGFFSAVIGGLISAVFIWQIFPKIFY